MKRKLLSACFVTLAVGVCAQTSIPNGNFEAWDADSFDHPRYYSENSNKEAIRQGFTFNCEKSTDAHHGSYAVKLTTVETQGEIMFGYFVNAEPGDNEPNDWHGGSPYNQKPTGIRGYYKSDIPAGDTALVLVAFSKNGMNLGTYMVKLYGTHSGYTLFNEVFSPALADVPDSFMLGATSSNVFMDNGIDGSTLTLDSISFTGVGSQPAQLNGDFEEWEKVTHETPMLWHHYSGEDLMTIKSGDAYKGSSALKLESSLVNWDGNMRANSGGISTGYYPRNCNPCNQMGGYPFTAMTDTLVFWYKYTAAGGSKGSVQYNLRANGNILNGNQMDLDPSASYQKVEIPILAMQTPDTLVVDFQSSRWTDSLPNQAGAVLIIDEVQLKSAPLNTGFFKPAKTQMVRVYPNPATGAVNIAIERIDDFPGTTLKLVNNLGQTVYVGEMNGANHRINLEGWPAGAYYYLLEGGGETLQSGKLIVQ